MVKGRPSGSVPAVRLRLRWREGRWELAGAIRVGPMFVLPTAKLPKSPTGKYTGFWIEIVDEREKTLYRRVLQDPTEPSIEIFDKGRPRRVPSQRSTAFLDLPVPDLPEGRGILVWGRQISPDERLPTAEVLARLPYPRES